MMDSITMEVNVPVEPQFNVDTLHEEQVKALSEVSNLFGLVNMRLRCSLLMGTLENSSGPKLLATTAKHLLSLSRSRLTDGSTPSPELICFDVEFQRVEGELESIT